MRWLPNNLVGIKYRQARHTGHGGHVGRYRHIRVEDKFDWVNKVRIVTVACPMEYPGLDEKERRKMFEGLALIADAYREADARCAKKAA